MAINVDRTREITTVEPEKFEELETDVISLDPTEVEGEVHKPKVQIIIPRAKFDFKNMKCTGKFCSNLFIDTKTEEIPKK